MRANRDSTPNVSSVTVGSRREDRGYLIPILIIISTLGGIFIPGVSAFTWSTAYTDTYDTDIITATGDGHGVSLGNVGIFSKQDLDADVLHVYRCQQGASPLCVRQTRELTDDTTDFSPEFIRLSDTSVAYCMGVSGAIKVYQSTNAGLSYTSTTSPAQSRDCAVAISGSSIWVASGNSTDSDIVFSKSLDGGSTWSPVFYSATSGDNIRIADGPITMAASDANNVILLYHRFGGGVGRCYTTTGGDTTEEWVCGTSQLFDALAGDEAMSINWYSTASEFRGVYRPAITSVGYFFFTSVSGLVSTQTVDSTSTQTSKPVLQTYNSTSIAVSWTDSGTDFFCKFGISHDNGLNWVPAEIAGTLVTGAPSSGSTTTFGTGGIHHVGCVGSDNDLDDGVAAVFRTAGTEISASASVTLTGLNGFDVEPSGGIAVARHESGDDVSIYDAGTGDLLGGPIETNCDLGFYEDAVMAKSLLSGNGANLVGFLNCDALGNAQYYSIREADGSTPEDEDFVEVQDSSGDNEDDEPCGTGSWAEYESNDALCPYDIDLAASFDGDPIDDGLGQLGQIQDWPIDYSNNLRETLSSQDTRQIAWAFASQQCSNPPSGNTYCDGDEPGLVGVAMASFRDVIVDDFNEDFRTGDDDESVNDFCLGLDAGNYYLASAANQGSHTWSVTFTSNAGPASRSLDADIGSESTFAAASGIACGGGQILVGTNSGTVALHNREGAFIDSITGVDPSSRNVAISYEFFGPASADVGETCTTASSGTNNCLQFGAYFEDSDNTIHILNLTGGSIVETTSFPGRTTGSHHSLRMDFTAQNVWEATSTGWSRWEILNETTVVPVTILPDPVDGDGPGDDDPGISAEEIQAFLESEVFWGIILVLVLALLGVAIDLKFKLRGTVTIILASLGFVVAGFLGWFHPLIILGVLLIAGAVLYARRGA